VAKPFQLTSRETGRLGRVFGAKRAAALSAVEELLAQAARVRDVTPDVLQGVCHDCGIDLSRRFKTDRKLLYRRYLCHCFEDKVLSPEESADLAHLRSILHLPNEDVAEIHEAVAREVYGKAIEGVVADMQLDEQEESFLRKLRTELRLPEQEAERLYAQGVWDARNRAMHEASSRDDDFVVQGTPAGEFTGRSTTTIEDAVADALAKASRVIPELHWFELIQTAGYVENGKRTGWHVCIRAGIRKEA
jgi:flavin-binding protein dodecin